jgi:outer membrane lipoprotein-sorting protein
MILTAHLLLTTVLPVVLNGQDPAFEAWLDTAHAPVAQTSMSVSHASAVVAIQQSDDAPEAPAAEDAALEAEPQTPAPEDGAPVTAAPQDAAPVLDDAPVTLPDRAALVAAAEAERAAAIARADAWFAALDTMQARFVQFAPDGTETSGDLALDRPGRVRFDYDDPRPILMVADGATVALADFQLETIDRVPLSATPLRYVLGADPLAASEAVDQVNRADGRIYITLIDPEGETDGRLTLIFHDPEPDAGAQTMVLEGWYVVDAMGGLTEIRLLDAALNQRLDPRLFILDDEDVMGGDRRRGRR